MKNNLVKQGNPFFPKVLFLFMIKSVAVICFNMFFRIKWNMVIKKFFLKNPKRMRVGLTKKIGRREKSLRPTEHGRLRTIEF